MDVSRQVFIRSARMGLGYVILSLVMGIFLTTSLNLGAKLSVTAPASAGFSSLVYLLVVPMGALVGLVITTPVYLLFVNDKNAGVLEYLLAVGMDQRDIFRGYLRAALMLSLIAMVPVVLLNLVFSVSGFGPAALGGVLAIVTGLSDVALVTVMMTAFSSMQRRPTGMNSPLGISIGVVLLLPDFLLLAVLKTSIIWVEAGVAGAILVASLFLFLSLDKIIRREKLLP